MSYNQNAPAATAPKGGDFVSFKPFEEDGPTILTIVAFNFIKDHVQEKEDGSTEVIDALEFFYGAMTEAGPRFIKTWPAKYSIHEKSNYAKLYKAATGSLPVVGSNPSDILGKGVQTILENENKVGKKTGKAYTKTSVKSVSPVKASAKASVTPLAKLLPLLEQAIEEGKPQQDDRPMPSKAAPGKAPAKEEPPF